MICELIQREHVDALPEQESAALVFHAHPVSREEAEQRFVELLGAQPAKPVSSGGSCNCSADGTQHTKKPAFWRSRYGEALVALGRHEDAYRVLSSLLVAAKLTEAEGAAALTRAATALSNTEMASAADARCRELAKKRTKSICAAEPKPTAAR